MLKAIIGGTGIYDIGEDSYTSEIATEYGEVEVDIINIQGEKIVFLPRHGREHSVPPHLINYRANMMALKDIGVKYIYSTVAVGSMNENFVPGDVVIIKDFIDFTKNRPVTFYEGGEEGVIHVDMTEPYCRNLNNLFMEESKDNIFIKGDGVYVCTEGPRFETSSEIKMYRKIGGDVVGMTNVPEVILAKELGMCYSAIGIVTNWCTGIETSEFTIHDITGSVEKNKKEITQIFIKVFMKELDQNKCKCKDSLIKL